MSDIPALLERFRRGPELIALALTGVFGNEEDFVSAPGKWSIRQIAGHIADSEIVAAHRIRQVIAEENPVLTWFDEKLWAANLDYSRRKPKQCLETLRHLRAETYELLRGAPETAFDRSGAHSTFGPKTLHKLVEDYATHVETHARQIQEIRDAYKAAKAGK